MEAIILIALIFFGPKILKALVGSSSDKSKPKSSQKTSKRPSTTYSKLSSNSLWKSPEFQDLKQTLQEMSGVQRSSPSSQRSATEKAQRKTDYEARQMRRKAEAAKRTRRLKAHDASHGYTVEVKDRNDVNKNRRADWGERVGPGILNTKTFITAVVFGLVLVYIMSTTQA